MKLQPLDHFRKVLALYPLTRLEALRRALEQDRVIRCTYTDGTGQGCLLFHLGDPATGAPITCKEQARLIFTDEDYPPARDLVRDFDNGLLDLSALEAALGAEIESRRLANAEEERAIAAAERRGARQ